MYVYVHTADGIVTLQIELRVVLLTSWFVSHSYDIVCLCNIKLQWKTKTTCCGNWFLNYLNLLLQVWFGTRWRPQTQERDRYLNIDWKFTDTDIDQIHKSVYMLLWMTYWCFSRIWKKEFWNNWENNFQVEFIGLFWFFLMNIILIDSYVVHNFGILFNFVIIVIMFICTSLCRIRLLILYNQCRS